MEEVKESKDNDIVVIGKFFFIPNLALFKMGQIKNIILLKKIAAVLKELRLAHNLTQEDVYNDTSIHVGRIEAYKVNLSLSTLSTLCSYFKISMSDFFKRVENI